MREHHAFRQSRCTAGIWQRYQIFARIDLNTRRVAVAFQQRIEWRGAVVLAKDEQLFNLCVPRGLTSFVSKLWRGHEQLRSGIWQLMSRLFGRVERIQGGVNAPEHRHGVKRDRIFRTVSTENAKDVAFAESLLRQTRGCAPHCVLELRVSPLAAGRPVDQRRLVLNSIRRLKNEISQRDIGNRNVGVWGVKNNYWLALHRSAMFIAYEVS